MTTIQARKINNLKVKPIPFEGGNDPRPVRGAEMFSEPFANIFIAAKKKSGKTYVVYNILKKCMSSKTKLVVFCSTINKDPSWRYMIKYYKDKGVDVATYTSLKEDGIDRLQELITDLENQIEPEDEEEEEIPPKEQLKMMGGALVKAILTHNLPPEITGEGKKKPRKSKYIDCEYIIVLDDLSTELKSKSLVGLLKKNRHAKAKIIVSSQYYLDLLPESRKQIDYFLLFKSQTDDKLQAIYKDADISIPYEKFHQLYVGATQEPYSFLYVDCREDKFRKNFDKELII
jgi:hypothetical protein